MAHSGAMYQLKLTFFLHIKMLWNSPFMKLSFAQGLLKHTVWLLPFSYPFFFSLILNVMNLIRGLFFLSLILLWMHQSFQWHTNPLICFCFKGTDFVNWFLLLFFQTCIVLMMCAFKCVIVCKFLIEFDCLKIKKCLEVMLD